MNNVFVLCNQHHEFLSKSREWLSEGDSKTLYRSAYRDEVINEKVELTVKQPGLRLMVLTAEQASNGRLTIDNEDCLAKASPDSNSEKQAQIQPADTHPSEPHQAHTDAPVHVPN